VPGRTPGPREGSGGSSGVGPAPSVERKMNGSLPVR
jgi:hypothetical protein